LKTTAGLLPLATSGREPNALDKASYAPPEPCSQFSPSLSIKTSWMSYHRQNMICEPKTIWR
jgi:hypothetical protein